MVRAFDRVGDETILFGFPRFAACAQSANTTAQRVTTVICFRMSFEVSNVELLHNDFIRSRQRVLRNRQSDLLRRLQIYHQLKIRRLLDWQIGRLGTLQDLSA